MLHFDIVTIFPEFFAGPFSHGILKRAQETELVKITAHDLRRFTEDKHRTVDDRPFGGGAGMVLKAEPVFKAVESLIAAGMKHEFARREIILLSPQGKKFTQAEAFRLAERESIILICGRYEGVDERVAEHLATSELSIGDYVLTGGELAAAVVVDAVTRLIPGALGNEVSRALDSFSFTPAAGPTGKMDAAEVGGLSWPQYTRPEEFRGWKVPEILMSGNHREIQKWREEKARGKTARMRPDLLPNLEFKAVR
ncbi:MAG: tRNA (guanosine(37)-N1)-methyltransferase TrmD [Acidobacteriia bacterium]|nr:tRNA (guanosine(37)-N1)-methyltransferase TrmD [Terriglobia bacterium]